MSLAKKESLTITRCKVSGGSISVLSGDANQFQAMINPSEYRHSHSISYSGAGKGKKSDDKDQPMGRAGNETRFAGVNAEDASFALVIDGTGVVGNPLGNPMNALGGATQDNVNTQIAKLKRVAYVYDGKEHEPPVVRVSWGKLQLSGSSDKAKYFYGRLKSLEVTYTVFMPSGAPLRAKVALGFVSFMTLEEEKKRANQSSPDLSHLVTVRAGDTLPLLCHEIYRDGRQYLFVARENGLTSARDLVPGTVLRFPPLPRD